MQARRNRWESELMQMARLRSQRSAQWAMWTADRDYTRTLVRDKMRQTHEVGMAERLQTHQKGMEELRQEHRLELGEAEAKLKKTLRGEETARVQAAVGGLSPELQKALAGVETFQEYSTVLRGVQAARTAKRLEAGAALSAEEQEAEEAREAAEELRDVAEEVRKIEKERRDIAAATKKEERTAAEEQRKEARDRRAQEKHEDPEKYRPSLDILAEWMARERGAAEKGEERTAPPTEPDVPKRRIRVRVIATGQIGDIPEEEFDAEIYERI